MLTSQFDPITLQQARVLVRGNFAARDELYAAADALSDDDLAEICRRLADKLGGNAAHLQQLLLDAGKEPVEPDGDDEVVRQLQEVVIEMLDERHGPRAVLSEAKEAEHRLKEQYDAAIETVAHPEVEGILRKQREEVAFGETVLEKVQAPAVDGDGKSGE